VDFIRIETPEKIRFKYRIAQTGTRAGAVLLDLLIQAGFLLIWGLLILLVQGGAYFSEMAEEMDSSLITTFSLLILFFLQWGYFSFFEIVMNGQTPGKKALKIFVIRNNGEKLDKTSVLLRNLLRVVDAFPLVYIVGGLVSVVDKQSRRLGDLLGETLVVIDEKKIHPAPDFSFPAGSLANDSLLLEETARKLARRQRYLNENQLYIIRQFMQKKDNMQEKQRNASAEKLKDMIEEYTGVEAGNIPAENYVYAVYKGHEVYENA